MQSSFVEVLLRGQIGPSLPFRQVAIRPVVLKRKPHLQFSYFDLTKNIVKNAKPDSKEATARLSELLQLPFSHATLRTTSQDVTVQVTKNGHVTIHKSAPAKPTGPISLEHNRVKDLPIPPQVPHPFLQRIGLQTAEGKVKAGMSDKFTQVNEFLKLLKHTGLFQNLDGEPCAAAVPQRGASNTPSSSSSSSSTQDRSSSDSVLEQLHSGSSSNSSGTRSTSNVSRIDESSSSSSSGGLHILDCGCGSSHLTFGLWHYTHNVLGVQAHVTGVDTNAELMARSNQYCRELGMAEANAQFVASPIITYQPAQQPDIVLALHACDTATDDALALAVKQGAPVVMAVPCCHKHLHRQLAGSQGNLIHPFRPLMAQGIVRQRFLDLLTDTLRASILRIMGYKVDIIEFISMEHTPRNILIRATKTSEGSGSKAARSQQTAIKEYVELKQFWSVVPYLETLLKLELRLAGLDRS